jgi:LuxR family transcriptional regulator, maltose regulon positive regulatory protein
VWGHCRRYTQRSANREIASDLCLSVNTIRTHVRHVYEKLAAHSRIEAVERARALGLLAPSARRP